MPTREVLSPAQRASLLTIPADFSERELARYYSIPTGFVNYGILYQ